MFFSADYLLYDLSFSSHQSGRKHTDDSVFFKDKNSVAVEMIKKETTRGPKMSFTDWLCVSSWEIWCQTSQYKLAERTLALVYLVRPVSGSTTLRITLCLASYSSLVRGLLVESRAFCSSVITAEGNNLLNMSTLCVFWGFIADQWWY